ncbi:DotU family type IV/VI secretion system protein [Pseudomonas marginalis]|nr:DotU family type IV/VI secretion system protein [Pseudomonas marginalis]
MNLTASKKNPASALDIDKLLQDSYLMVVELRHGAVVQDTPELWRCCVRQVKQVYQALQAGGVSTKSTALICHAQSALFDETVLSRAEGAAHARWAGKPLQAHLFNRHQAGEFLYEDMRQALRQPMPDLLVLTVFQRVMLLGFRGRYRDLNDPERQRLMDALNAHVPPLTLNPMLTTQGSGSRKERLSAVRSPWVRLVLAGVLLVGVWWGLDQMLGSLVTTLTPGQA